MTRQLIIGMPESGKSTYIGALRHILVAKEVDTELELTMLAGEEVHLNKLEDKWLSCEAMERTKTSNEAWVEFNVRDRSTGVEGLIIIPDLRGENFERPAAAGGCPKDLHQALVASDGVLLFTNVNREDDMLLIDDFGDLPEDDEGESLANDGLADGAVAGAVAATPGDEFHDSETNTAKPADRDETKFRPEDMAEEVKIVEFLQMANRRPLYPKSRKLALIASAWDLVEAEEGITPEKWFAQKRPMLAQFLANNVDLWEMRVYGVSAQGGKLPERKAEFESMLHQSKRVRIIGHGAALHDLSAPLRWLMTTA
jgi:hypothetical protein